MTENAAPPDPVNTAKATLKADEARRLAAAQVDLDALIARHRVTIAPFIERVEHGPDETVIVVPGVKLVALP